MSCRPVLLWCKNLQEGPLSQMVLVAPENQDPPVGEREYYSVKTGGGSLKPPSKVTSLLQSEVPRWHMTVPYCTSSPFAPGTDRPLCPWNTNASLWLNISCRFNHCCICKQVFKLHDVITSYLQVDPWHQADQGDPGTHRQRTVLVISILTVSFIRL